MSTGTTFPGFSTSTAPRGISDPLGPTYEIAPSAHGFIVVKSLSGGRGAPNCAWLYLHWIEGKFIWTTFGPASTPVPEVNRWKSVQDAAYRLVECLKQEARP